MALVALVDDHQLFSASLALALRSEGLHVTIPPLSTPGQLREDLIAARPEVVLLDRNLGPLGSGEDLIGTIAGHGSAVIVISATLDDIVVGRCLARGASICLPKTEPFDALLATVLSVAAGSTPVPATERVRLIQGWRRSQASADATSAVFAQLTPREASVLGRLMVGRPVRAIAAEAFVSEATIRSQVRGILVKLGVNSQLEAVALATQAGWQRSKSPVERTDSAP